MNQENQYINYVNINESLNCVFNIASYEKTARDYFNMYASFLPKNKSSSILDIGCGCGYFLYFLKKYGYDNYWGIDADPESIDYTKRNITEKCEAALAYQYLTISSQKYDLIVMNEVLEHIPKNEIIPLINLIFKSLNKDGVFICYVPNMENPITSYTRYHDFTHTVGFTQNSLKMVLKMGGFVSVNIYEAINQKNTINYRIKRLAQKIIKKLLVRLFSYPRSGMLFSMRIYAIAKK